jgi:ribose transport system substrate-binding protein
MAIHTGNFKGGSKMKLSKLLTGCFGIAMIASLTSCQSTTSSAGTSTPASSIASSTPTVKKTVAIMVPSADHGWTGAVLTYAQSHAADLNKTSAYNYVVYASSSDEDQLNKIDDLIATKNSIAGIVIDPYSNAVESGMTKIANSGIPFTMFDRIITNDTISAATNYVSAVAGDNKSIGTVTANKYLTNGLAKTDKVLLMPGDNSSVPALRTQGFTDALITAGWTQAEVTAAITTTDYTNWSRDTAKEKFINWINATTVADLASYKWIYTHDDEIFCAIFEALASSEITDAKKAAFKDAVLAINGCGGLEECFQIIRGDHPRSSTYNAEISANCNLYCATYDPAMITNAIDDMADHLANKTVTKDHIIASQILDKAAVQNKVGFGGKVTA